jgi:hypothetical protein
MWRNHFFHPLNVHGVNDVRQTEIHTAEPIVTDSILLRFSWQLKFQQNWLKQEVRQGAPRSIRLLILHEIRKVT